MSGRAAGAYGLGKGAIMGRNAAITRRMSLARRLLAHPAV
jgi:hypothetical protein